MSEAQLMNDDAARSPTGEILDQATATTPTPTPTPTETQSTESGQPPKDPTTEAPKPDAKTTAPDTYTDFTLPEGASLSKEALDAAIPIFKDLGLSQEAAQKLVDFHAQQMIAAAKAPETTYAATRDEWRKAANADPDMRGKLGPGGEISTAIGRALDSLGDAKLATDFRDAMNLTGAGDNPAFIKTFWKMAQRFAEGSHVSGASPSPEGQRDPSKPSRPSPAQALYPRNP